MERGRGALIDKCWRCGQWLHRASAEQHAALQAVLEDIALQVQWPPKSGELIGVSRWWQLIVASYDRLNKETAELMPAIDGVGFDGNGFDFVRGERRRRRLNSREISEIIEFARSWGANEHGVKFREFEKKRKAA